MTRTADRGARVSTADRRRVHARRQDAERLVQLAQHLADPDRLLIEQRYRHGLTCAEVARLTGTAPRTVQRRAARLLRHMRSPLYRFVSQRHELLPRETQAVARRAILEGRTLRHTARLTGLTLHQVRQHLQHVRTLARVF